MSELVAYFGFGSLVNKHTLRTSYLDIVPARLNGWRRHWQGRTHALDQDVALLSVHRSAASQIDGMVVIDQLANLPLVDEREIGYTRHELSAPEVELLEAVNLPDKIYVYVADEVEDDPHGGPLLQSYLDAVMQGFSNEFGAEGVQRFIDTTDGFQRKMIADRATPLYPRSVSLSQAEVDLFDQSLNTAGVVAL